MYEKEFTQIIHASKNNSLSLLEREYLDCQVLLVGQD